MGAEYPTCGSSVQVVPFGHMVNGPGTFAASCILQRGHDEPHPILDELGEVTSVSPGTPHVARIEWPTA